MDLEICVFAVSDRSSGYKSVKMRNFAISDKNEGNPQTYLIMNKKTKLRIFIERTIAQTFRLYIQSSSVNSKIDKKV